MYACNTDHALKNACSKDRAMDLNAFERKVRNDDVRFVRFLYCDTSGIIRGKSVHIDKLIERVRGGIGLTVAMPAMNMLDQLQAGRRPGAGRRNPAGARHRQLRPTALRAEQRRHDGEYGDAGSRALGRVRARFPRTHDRARAEGRRGHRGGLRAGMDAGDAPGGRVLRPRRPEPLLQHRRLGDIGRRDRRHRRRAGGAGHAGRAVLSRAGPRPAGAVDSPCDGPARRR